MFTLVPSIEEFLCLELDINWPQTEPHDVFTGSWREMFDCWKCNNLWQCLVALKLHSATKLERSFPSSLPPLLCKENCTRSHGQFVDLQLSYIQQYQSNGEIFEHFDVFTAVLWTWRCPSEIWSHLWVIIFSLERLFVEEALPSKVWVSLTRFILFHFPTTLKCSTETIHRLRVKIFLNLYNLVSGKKGD